MDGSDGAAVHLHPPVPAQRARGQGARREARPGDASQRGLRGRRGHRRVRDVRPLEDKYVNTPYFRYNLHLYISTIYILYILLKISSLNKQNMLPIMFVLVSRYPCFCPYPKRIQDLCSFLITDICVPQSSAEKRLTPETQQTKAILVNSKSPSSFAMIWLRFDTHYLL